jgi:hypothetical protein
MPEIVEKPSLLIAKEFLFPCNGQTVKHLLGKTKHLSFFDMIDKLEIPCSKRAFIK